MTQHIEGSQYVRNERREYSLYTLQSRAIPLAADGLKAAARRVLWTAKDGKKHKSATLAGATMPLHPHASPESTINTLAAFYGNNIPLLKGEGALGTLLAPSAYGAARYTSVSLSAFAKDVMFKDVEIISMTENYDGTLLEPLHFLPIIPMTFINPQEGIAVGFASNILGRDPAVIIKNQIQHLEGAGFKEAKPALIPINQYSTGREEDRFGNLRWGFKGSFEKVDAVSVRVTNLPYGLSHDKFEERLLKFEEEQKIQEFTDSSKDQYNILIRFKKGELRNMSDDEVLSFLGLTTTLTENINVIDFDGKRVWDTNYIDFIKTFTDWRLKWYLIRYERLAKLLAEDIQRYRDILTAIAKNLGSVARKVQSRSELRDFCENVGIVYLDYIVDLPVYRFTEDEKNKVEQKIKEAEALMKVYQSLIKSENKRKGVYIEELQEILTKYNKGIYSKG